MKRILFVTLVVALSCIGFTDAKASYYFTFTDTAGAYSLTGTLLTSTNGPGPLDVLAGSFGFGTGTSPNISGVTFSMPTGAGSNGAFYWDQKIYPGLPLALTSGGLLFTSGTSNLNIWADGSYAFGWVPDGANQNGMILGSGTFSLTPTPIPGAVWLLGSGLLGLVGIGRKRLKR